MPSGLWASRFRPSIGVVALGSQMCNSLTDIKLLFADLQFIFKIQWWYFQTPSAGCQSNGTDTEGVGKRDRQTMPKVLCFYQGNKRDK